MPTIAEVRKKYPQYGDLSDQELADALHAKFYADVPKPEFYGKIGLAPAAPAASAAPAQEKRPLMAAKPTKPLVGSGPDGRVQGLGELLPALADQMYRTYGGAAADFADGVTGLINRPINATLDAVGVDPKYRLPVDQVGAKVAEPEGLVPQVVRDLAPYIGGTVGASRGLTQAAPKAAAAMAGGGEAAIAAKVAPAIRTPVRAGITAGAPIDAAMSATQDSNLSNLIAELGGPELPTARQPGEPEGAAAIKDMTEGAVVGGLAEKLLDAFVAGRRSMQAPQSIPQDPVAVAPIEELPPAYAEEIIAPPPKADIEPAVAGAEPDIGFPISEQVQEVKPPKAGAEPAVVADPTAEVPVRETPPAAPVEEATAVPAREIPQDPRLVAPEQALEEAAAQADAPQVAGVAKTAPEGARPPQVPEEQGGLEAAAARGELPAPSGRTDGTPTAGSAAPPPEPGYPVGSARGPLSPEGAAARAEVPPSAVGSQEQVLDVAAPKVDEPLPDAPMATAGATADDFDAEAFYARTFGKDAKPIPGPDPKRGGTKLYSNPADPEAVKELLVDPAVRVFKKEADAFSSDLAQIRQDIKGLRENFKPKDAASAAARTVRKVWWSNTAAIRAVAAKHKNVPEIRELADKIGTDPGRGRVVPQTYERAVQMRSMGMSNRMSNLLGDKVKPEFEARIADTLAGRLKPVSGSREEEVARRMRKLLDEQHDYMTQAGLDVGYVKGRYYPRVLDERAVLKDPLAFKAKAAEVYKMTGLDEAQAAEAAEDWYSRVLGIKSGFTDVGPATAKYTKGRTLPPEADDILAEFYEKDPRRNLTNYFRQTSRAAEFARAFGPNGEKIDELFNGMLKKGVSPNEVNSLRDHFESAAGLLYSTRPTAEASALGWIQTAGVLRLLPRATISSLAEGLATGIRAHDAGAGFKAMVDSYTILFKMDDAADVRQTAEFLGIVGDAMNDLVISAQFGGEIGGLAQQKLLSRFFRTTYLHQVTEAQRLAATRVGQGMIRTLIQDLTSGNARQASAKRLLAELGMDEASARGVAQWLESNGGSPRLADLMGDKPEAKAYRTALQRFVDESIQNPTAADRPQWANHPYGRLAYGITSFMFSFTRNVLIRTARETGEGVFGKGYTLEDRARLLAPAIALATLTAAQGQVSEFRDMLLNPGAREERTDREQLMMNLSRAGAFGNADPFINVAMSLRYSRDFTSMLTGPYLTAYLDSLGKAAGLMPGINSPNTNNAEWQAAKAAYEALAAPLIAAAASYAPGGPILRAGYGAGVITATGPGAARGVADAVAGERDVKPRVNAEEEEE